MFYFIKSGLAKKWGSKNKCLSYLAVFAASLEFICGAVTFCWLFIK